jgi:C1A family cysteine protease
MSSQSSYKPSDMISSVELSMSYGTNPVNTVSHVLSQSNVNTLALGANSVPITTESIVNILSNVDSNVDFIPSLKITYTNGTISTAQGTIYNDPPASSRYGWKQGEAYSLIQPKMKSSAAVTLALSTPYHLIPNFNSIPVYDQGSLGSCTANSLAYCFDYCRLTQGLPLLNTPSRLFIYYNERNYEGTTASDDGAQIYDGVKVLNEIGVCSSTLWPYEWPTPPPPPPTPPTPPLYRINYNILPPPNCYSQASQNIALTFNAVSQSLVQIKAVIRSGYPVEIGIQVFDYFESRTMASTGMLECPSNPIDMSTSIGGHAVVIVGYDDNIQTLNGMGAFVFRNSWGSHWGVEGYFFMPYQYITGPSNPNINLPNNGVDQFGNNYYNDLSGNALTLVTDLWTINTVATNNVTVGRVDASGNRISGYGQLQFYQPCCVAVDLSGNYVVADTFNHRIQVVSPSGQFIRFIGSLGLDASGNPLYGSGNCQFYQPNGVAVDLSGNYVITDTYNDRIQVISPLGVFIRQFGSYATGGNGYFNAPDGVAIDLSGNYVIADSGNNLIQVISPLGIFQRQFTSYTNLSQSNSPINFNNPSAVAIDLSGNYVVSNTGINCIVVISPLGNFVRQFGSGGSTMGDGNLNNPTGVAVDFLGNYLVADSGNNLIQIFTPSGEYYSELGSVSLTSTNGSIPGTFNSPQGVAVDNTGKYIVVDSGNSRILAFNV